VRFAIANSCLRISLISPAMLLRSASARLVLPACTSFSRICCNSSPASPSALSLKVIALSLASTARWFAVLRASAASARSARAAAAGSSLARLTRLPLVSCSCALARFCCRVINCSSDTL